MLKKIGKFVFSDPSKLLEMLNLRRAGWTFVSLSEYYNCDRTSLRYQCRKYQIFPHKTVFTFDPHHLEVFDPKRITRTILLTIYPKEDEKWTLIDGERVNLGRSYTDYLKRVSPYRK